MIHCSASKGVHGSTGSILSCSSVQEMKAEPDGPDTLRASAHDGASYLENRGPGIVITPSDADEGVSGPMLKALEAINTHHGGPMQYLGHVLSTTKETTTFAAWLCASFPRRDDIPQWLHDNTLPTNCDEFSIHVTQLGFAKACASTPPLSNRL